MAKKLPNEKADLIKALIFQRADEVGYARSGRIENGKFLDDLVEEAEIGGVLRQYMDKARVRTYIKDGVLNAYTKQLIKTALASKKPKQVVKIAFNDQAEVIQKKGNISVLRAASGTIYVVSNGTVLKWETALKKALELIAQEPTLIQNNVAPKICLHLGVLSNTLADSDKVCIKTALDIIGVNAVISEG